MARGVVGSVIGYVRAHPYLTAGVAVAAAEVMRSRDCPRGVTSTLASLVALAATANAGVAAAGAVDSAVWGNPSGADIFANPYSRAPGQSTGSALSAWFDREMGRARNALDMSPGSPYSRYRWNTPELQRAAANVEKAETGALDALAALSYARGQRAPAARITSLQHTAKLRLKALEGAVDGAETAHARRNPSVPEPRSRYSPEGRLTALPVVKVSGLKTGTVVLGKHGKPAVIGAKGPKLAKDQVLVLGRWDRPQVITRSCGNSSGGPGTVLATGKTRKGCNRADAARVMGIKSWRDSLANTTLRQAAALNALKAAFKSRGIKPPAEFKTAAAQATAAATAVVKSNLAVMTQRRAARAAK